MMMAKTSMKIVVAVRTFNRLPAADEELKANDQKTRKPTEIMRNSNIKDHRMMMHEIQTTKMMRRETKARYNDLGHQVTLDIKGLHPRTKSTLQSQTMMKTTNLGEVIMAD
jgi:hypothetical protein